MIGGTRAKTSAERLLGRGTYRRAMGASLSTAVGASLSWALLEIARTLLRAHLGFGREMAQVAALTLAFYGCIGLALGVGEAIVLGAVEMTAPNLLARLWSALRDDERADRRAASALLAAGAAAGLFSLLVGEAALQLVAHSARKAVGAVVTGGVAAALVPIAVLAGVVVFRLARRIVALLPRPRSVPVTVEVGLVMTVSVGAWGASVLLRLDWRALHLGPLIAAAGVGGLQLVWAALRSREWWLRLRHEAVGALVFGALALVSGVATHPSRRALADLREEGFGTPTLTRIALWLGDRDGDGWSSWLGGGDCNDRDPRVHPGAIDIPEDGVDQNCIHGDAPAPTLYTPPPVEPGYRLANGNLLLIFIDTLRADRLTPRVAPRMTELAARGAWFRRAWTQAPHTPRAWPVLMTSRLPSWIDFGGGRTDFSSLKASNVTVFEALRDSGVHTAGVASFFYFDIDGVAQGIDDLDNFDVPDPEEAAKDVTSPRVTARAIARLNALAASGQRFSLMVHYPDPHASYVPHPGLPHQTEEQAYDSEVTFTDRYVGMLLDALAAGPAAESTMVVLFSDHGETFGGKHRRSGQAVSRHGYTLYQEELCVPLVFAGPGIAPRVIDTPVGLMDVAPTVLEALSVPRPPSFRGRSLAPALIGKPLAPEPIYAEHLLSRTWPRLIRARLDADGRTKLIDETTDARYEVFDVLDDPDEQRDLVQRDPPRADEARQRFGEWVDSLWQPNTEDPAATH
jgi:arylsulfatase A-like enzyme